MYGVDVSCMYGVFLLYICVMCWCGVYVWCVCDIVYMCGLSVWCACVECLFVVHERCVRMV